MAGFRAETLNSRNPNPNSRRRKPSNPPNHGHYRSNSRMTVATKFPLRNLIAGEVKILKRGEPIPKIDDNQIEKDSDLKLGSTERLGPDPETVQKQIRVGISRNHAGSSFVATSPHPSSVPFPGFIGNRCNGVTSSGLRRLLRIE